MAGVVELGWWPGGEPPDLRPHFHDEAQIVFVLSGARSFLMEDGLITATAGHAVYIPVGRVHASRAAGQAATCVNVYLPEPNAARLLTLFAIERRWTRGGELRLQEFLHDLDGLPCSAPPQDRPFKR